MKNETQSKGILGLGSSATLYYLEQIQAKFRKNNEEFSTCPYLLYQIDFQEINPHLPNQFSVLIPKLKVYLEQISKLGIKQLLVPNITLHETLDQIQFDTEICHPVHLTTHYLNTKNISSITLFGTIYTMNSSYVTEKLSRKNIEVFLPTKEDQLWIDQFRKVVAQKEVSQSQVMNFHLLIKKYAIKNPVVLACTELSIHALKIENYCIDMAALQIEKFLQ
jgi:aspartate racemase